MGLGVLWQKGMFFSLKPCLRLATPVRKMQGHFLPWECLFFASLRQLLNASQTASVTPSGDGTGDNVTLFLQLDAKGHSGQPLAQPGDGHGPLENAKSLFPPALGSKVSRLNG